MKNPILDEVRRVRLQIAEETGNTVEGLWSYLDSRRDLCKKWGLKFSDRKPVKPKRRKKAA